MNGFKRFINWLKALFNHGMDKLEDPEIMLDQAKRDMTQCLLDNREKAVQAIAQKNRLERMVEEAREKSELLERYAEQALKSGNRDLAKSFLAQKATHDKATVGFAEALEGAKEVVESVKVAIKRQEEQVRQKAAEALALKAQWKQAQIQSSITKSLEGLTFENQYESSFNEAKGRIEEKQAEAKARQEMFGESLVGKTWELENQVADTEADQALAELEQRLGLATSTTASVDGELEKLEQQIAVGGMPTTPNLDGLTPTNGSREQHVSP